MLKKGNHISQMQHKAHFRLRKFCHWYGKYIVKKNQYNNDIRAGENDIRVQG